ncbi:MAG: histidinol-phosphatase HisJ family protein [Clostridia bacterium]|nr:histidinol-phosphatase HisJ family protein [Clostridia bacterium]
MKYLQNLHTHSTYCDGKDTLREMLDTAIEKGFESIGFSGHSPVPFPSIYAMSSEGEREYKKEIETLKEEYFGRLDIFCGVELDSYNASDFEGYDYIIGSHHYFERDGKMIGFDRSAEEVRSVINEYFEGDGLLFAKAYYEDLASHLWKTSVDVLGHIDIITKNCEKADLFDWRGDKYLSYVLEAISSLKNRIQFFEVNTGAISRGYRTTPYPTLEIMRELKAQGYGAVISSDCHNREFLDCGFDLARGLLIEAGFNEKYILTKNGFCAVAL